MLSLEEVRIDQFYANSSSPFGMKITHLPTGIQVEGNCKNEQSLGNVQNALMNALGQFVANEMGKRPKVNGAPAADDENAYLREQLLAMQAQLNALMAAQQPNAFTNVERAAKALKPAKAAKAKRGMSAANRKAASERMKARHAAKAPAEPEPAEATLLAQQMRPPTDAPMDLPHRQSKGSTVAKSNVDWIKP